MKRNIINQFVEWKNKKNRKPLIVTGVLQCGKTYLIKEFGKTEFEKYATAETTTKIKLVWNSIPSQIAKENNKFIFSHVKQGARAKDLEDALEWLVNAGISYKLKMVSTPQIPLAGIADNTYFKVYMMDVGLLRRKSNINYRTILTGDENFIQFKGALTENYCMTELKTAGIESYFWRSLLNLQKGLHSFVKYAMI